jgi:hypothetical protein
LPSLAANVITCSDDEITYRRRAIDANLFQAGNSTSLKIASPSTASGTFHDSVCGFAAMKATAAATRWANGSPDAERPESAVVDRPRQTPTVSDSGRFRLPAVQISGRSNSGRSN